MHNKWSSCQKGDLALQHLQLVRCVPVLWSFHQVTKLPVEGDVLNGFLYYEPPCSDWPARGEYSSMNSSKQCD